MCFRLERESKMREKFNFKFSFLFSVILGLRIATLAAVGCILIGAVGRCITQHAEALLW